MALYNWVSIDPATVSGVAYWKDDQLLATTVIAPVGKRGTWRVGEHRAQSRIIAYRRAIHPHVPFVVVERGAGRFAAAVRSQGKVCGYIEAICDLQGIPYRELVVSEWRRVIREDQNVSWPSKSEKCKALSVALVERLYGKTVTDDEADAVLLGRAALRLGMVEGAYVKLSTGEAGR